MLFISLSVLQGQFSHHYRLLSTKVIVLSVKKKIIPNWDKTKRQTENMEDWFLSTKETNKQTKKQNKKIAIKSKFQVRYLNFSTYRFKLLRK